MLEPTTELERLAVARLAFTEAMMARLADKYTEGYTGWDDPSEVSDDQLAQAIRNDIEGVGFALQFAHVPPGLSQEKLTQLVDIAARAMMLWWRHRGADHAE